jgi:hypothetical protein
LMSAAKLKIAPGKSIVARLPLFERKPCTKPSPPQ